MVFLWIGGIILLRRREVVMNKVKVNSAYICLVFILSIIILKEFANVELLH
jgi:hypothetical protein